MADPASVLEIYGCSLFIRFRNPSSSLRKSEATDGTMRPSEERVGIRGARAYHCSMFNLRWSESPPGRCLFPEYPRYKGKDQRLGLPVLSLITMIAVTNGKLFMVKAGILSGFYYFQAAAVILAILPMTWFPRFAPLIFGMVAAACFFVTGLKYRLRRQRKEP